MSSIIPLLLLLALMWVMLIRPQRERARRHQQLLGSLQVGDEVVGGGGLIGRVVEVGERWVRLEVAPGTVVRVVRQGILDRIPPPDDEGHEAMHPGEAETE